MLLDPFLWIEMSWLGEQTTEANGMWKEASVRGDSPSGLTQIRIMASRPTGIKILFWWGHSSLFPSSLFLLSAQKVYHQTASIMVGASLPSTVSGVWTSTFAHSLNFLLGKLCCEALLSKSGPPFSFYMLWTPFSSI